ncbi:MAG TPA: L,D-transpeptidase family protein, partial [Myxococcota bacterium]|nr:L,D-transpeptidase family protein [Myxococcota bacterium]
AVAVIAMQFCRLVVVVADEPWQRIRPLVGTDSEHLVEPGETLHDVAYVHRLGFEGIRRLNRELDPWIPPAGSVVRLPTRAVLPAVEPEGLVINVPEMRLYDFTSAGDPRVLAVAVGDPEDPTPVSRFRVGEKRVDPVWNVPKSIRAERPHLPAQVPAGPDNPLGTRWMTLGATSYGIHGTNVKWSIGRGSTHGCVRLYGDVMESLFERVPKGTPVAVLYEPYKWGSDGQTLYLEAHPDPYDRIPNHFEAALALPRQLDLLPRLDLDLVWETVQRAEGVPTPVGTLP